MGLQLQKDDFVRCDAGYPAECYFQAADLLRAFGHEVRFLILRHLGESEKTVGQLRELIGCRQSGVSQQVGRLRLEGIIQRRRQGKAVYYRIADDRHREVIQTIAQLFDSDEPTERGRKPDC